MKENYTMAKFTFPLDKKKFSSKAQMYDYIERTYPHLLSDDMPASRLYFNLKYNKTVGRSVISGKPTKWNPITERYERFANDHEKALYVKEFKARMKAKYGKEHLLNDPNKQKEMLSNRTISISSNGIFWITLKVYTTLPPICFVNHLQYITKMAKELLSTYQISISPH